MIGMIDFDLELCLFILKFKIEISEAQRTVWKENTKAGKFVGKRKTAFLFYIFI